MNTDPSYYEVLASLADSKVRYLVAGGIAMNFHGLQRSTVDLDLIIYLEKENILAFVMDNQSINIAGLKDRLLMKKKALRPKDT